MCNLFSVVATARCLHGMKNCVAVGCFRFLQCRFIYICISFFVVFLFLRFCSCVFLKNLWICCKQFSFFLAPSAVNAERWAFWWFLVFFMWLYNVHHLLCVICECFDLRFGFSLSMRLLRSNKRLLFTQWEQYMCELGRSLYMQNTQFCFFFVSRSRLLQNIVFTSLMPFAWVSLDSCLCFRQTIYGKFRIFWSYVC